MEVWCGWHSEVTWGYIYMEQWKYGVGGMEYGVMDNTKNTNAQTIFRNYSDVKL